MDSTLILTSKQRKWGKIVTRVDFLIESESDVNSIHHRKKKWDTSFRKDITGAKKIVIPEKFQVNN